LDSNSLVSDSNSLLSGSNSLVSDSDSLDWTQTAWFLTQTAWFMTQTAWFLTQTAWFLTQTAWFLTQTASSVRFITDCCSRTYTLMRVNFRAEYICMNRFIASTLQQIRFIVFQLFPRSNNKTEE